MEGGCDCGQVRYRLASEPIVVHCCHCSWCQRESGASFALNAVIERDRIELLGAVPERIENPSASGRGQPILRCPVCKVAVWSHYSSAGDKAAFIRVGTLDDPNRCPPDVHIYTASKQAWVTLPEGATVYPEFYPPADLPAVWGEAGLERWRKLMGKS